MRNHLLTSQVGDVVRRSRRQDDRPERRTPFFHWSIIITSPAQAWVRLGRMACHWTLPSRTLRPFISASLIDPVRLGLWSIPVDPYLPGVSLIDRVRTFR